MGWFVAMEIFWTLLKWVRLGRKSESEKTLEILLLRRQLAIVVRTLDKPIRPSRREKLTLAVLTAQLKAKTGRTAKDLGDIIRIVQPETVLKWHRELVRRKWTQHKKSRGGRPRTAPEIEQLVLRLARENDWGNGKIEGELIKLGYEISDETVANITQTTCYSTCARAGPFTQLASFDDALQRTDSRLRFFHRRNNFLEDYLRTYLH